MFYTVVTLALSALLLVPFAGVAQLAGETGIPALKPPPDTDRPPAKASMAATSRLSAVRLEDIPVYQLPPLEEESAASKAMWRPWGGLAIGRVREVTIAPSRYGRTLRTAAGRLDVLAITSTTAKRVRLRLRWLEPRPAGTLLVSSAANPSEAYEYPLRDGSNEMEFWTPPLTGDTAVLKYFLPAAAENTKAGQPPYMIVGVSHSFVDPIAMEEVSLKNHCPRVDVPASWNTVAPAVVGLDLISGNDEMFCTGTLINNQASDYTPYLLTANHCVDSVEKAHALRVWWFYDSTDPILVLRPHSDRAELLSTQNAADGSDYSLLLLLGSLPREDVIWAGWTTAMPWFGTAVVGIHHPGGAAKTISYGDIGIGCPAGECTPSTCDNFLSVDWDDDYGGSGIEKGSSGSPLFRDEPESPQLVGQLYCGTPCSTTGHSSYGRFDHTYNELSDLLSQGGGDDPREDNDSQDQASATSSGVYEDLVIKWTDDDWYRITVPAGRKITVWVDFEHDYGDVDISLYEGATFIDSSESTTDRESFSATNSSPGSLEYYVHVYLFGGVRNSYQLTVALGSLPALATGGVTAVGPTTVTLLGAANPNGLSTLASFYWGLTPSSYSMSSLHAFPGSGTSTVPIEVPLSGLVCDTLYYYRAVATNSAGTTQGADRTFRTLPCQPLPPAVKTDAAVAISLTSAKFQGKVIPQGASTAAYFQWGLTQLYGNVTPAQDAGSGTSEISFNQSLFNLMCDTLYHFQAVGTNSVGTAYGEDRTFRTTACPLPTVTTAPATSVESESAVLEGLVNPNGSLTRAYFQWGPTTGYGNVTPVQGRGSGTAALPLSAPLAGLSCNTLYYYRVVAPSTAGVGFGSRQSFRTSACPPPPSVATLPAAPLGPTSATLNGSVNPNGSATTAYFEWGLTTAYGSATAPQDVGAGNSAILLAFPLSGLTCTTTYHYRMVGSSARGTVQGTDQAFETGTCPIDFALPNGIAHSDSMTAGAPASTWDFYFVDLENGDFNLTAELYGLTGDADLYVRRGAKPDSSTFDCRPLLDGLQVESCSWAAPQAGRWWIGVVNSQVGSLEYTLRARWIQPLKFFTITPCRALDTRQTPQGALISGVPLYIQIRGICGIPTTAKAVSTNVTAVNQTGGGHIVLWPADVPKPNASTINFRSGVTRANNAILFLGTGDPTDLAAQAFVAGNGSVSLILDINGYFE